ncbi:MAG TPA: ATP-binding protein, partial [Kofleriaceae bacterium]|nr:ATP-binding protein [Kofleriaceae bacterium]
ALTLFSDVMVYGPIHARVDAIGIEARLAPTTPWMGVAMAVIISLLVYEGGLIRRRFGPSIQFRRLCWLGIVLIVLAVNDMLDAANVISTTQTLEYGFVLFALLPTHDELDRMVAAKAGLENIVGARTEELAAGQARFRRLADATLEAVLYIAAGKVADANRAALRMFGDPLIGATVTSLVADVDRPRIEAAIAADTEASIEVNVIGAGGDPIVAAVRLRGDVVLIRDIREDKRMQQTLLQADRLSALGTLAAGTAHEINNPLAYVLGNTECLIERLDDLGLTTETRDDVRALLDDILDGGRRVRKIVSKMVSLSRDLPADGPCDLVRTLDDALAFASHQIHHRAEVIVELPELPLVVGDAGRLGQVFRNLIVNAFQAIPAGHASSNRISLAGRRDGTNVVVDISDTGRGIEPAVIGRIFDPFFTTKPVGEGTGLGLSICHSVITGLAGTITVTSVVGRGTTFRVVLPVAEVPATAAAPEPAKPLHILVIDDELQVARALARMLRQHDTEIVTDGERASERCVEGKFDVILCDLMLPNRSGMEIYRAVRDIDPARANRMLFITGGVFTGEAEAFLTTIPDRWLAKPVNTETLRAAVARIARIS